MKTFLLFLIGGVICAAESAPDIPAQVLADAQAASAPKPLVPSPEALQTADEVDVLLITVGTFLAKQQPEKSGERFIVAVQAMEKISRADKRALGQRYTEQRRQLTTLANRLLEDPAIAAALGNDPLAPTAAEHQAATRADALVAPQEVAPTKP